MEVGADQLKRVVQGQHGGTAKRVTKLRVKEVFEGKTVWEGIVHILDLEGHPKATRAYAWSSPIEPVPSVGSMPCCILAALNRRWMPFGRLLWENSDPGDEIRCSCLGSRHVSDGLGRRRVLTLSRKIDGLVGPQKSARHERSRRAVSWRRTTSAVRPSHICTKQMLCRSELLGTKLARANYAARP